MYTIIFIFTLREYAVLIHWKHELMHDSPKVSMKATVYFQSFGKKFLVKGNLYEFL